MITHTTDTKLRRTIRWLSLREQTASWRVRNRLIRPLLLPLYNKRLGCKITDRLGLRRRAFARAYRNGAWTGTSESLSGEGSGLGATEALRAALPDALRQLNVRVLLDVPCGDWHWISHVVLPVDRYIGGDIVASVIDRNRKRFADERHEFRVLDLWNDPLPTADLMLCRDALVHFSNADIWRALNNIIFSDITFIAVTTFPATTTNIDLITGIGWRHLNLQAAPFNFPPPLMSLPEGFNRSDQLLSVWRVSDIPGDGDHRLVRP